jgi:signal transduction histidine kinase
MMTIYVQLLQREFQGQLSGSATEYMQNVVDGAQRISRLIDGLLQFTRLGGAESIKPSRVDAGVALEEALEDLRMSIAETDATVTHPPLPDVLAEPTHLRQVFQNLIGNSIKYRRPGLKPQIQICCNRDGDYWQFTIRDNGIGVAYQHHDQIFLPFKRLHGSEVSGAGIGLATCKRIVERYGGRIWVSSEENRGAEFSFTLPAPRGADMPSSRK